MKKKIATKKKAVKSTAPPYMLDKVESVPLAQLKLWKENPRQNDKAVPKLAKILAKHGVRSPIVVWKKNMVIYKGNTTFKAAKSLGWKKLPVALVDFPSIAAANAYGIADNKAGEYSEWDNDLLSELLSSESMNSYQGAMGFEETELNGFLMRPDLSRFTKVTENTDGLKSVFKILCPPEIKDKVEVYLEKTLVRKFGEDIIIRGGSK